MMQRVASAFLAVSAIGVLAGCANSSALPAAAPDLSKACVYSVVLEWADTDFLTRQDAVSALITSYEVELEKASSLEGLEPSADDSPVRLEIIVRGLTAALDQVVEAERADPEARNVLVVGMLNGAAISEVYVDQTGDGTYVVSQFTAFGLTTDDPYCA